MKRRILLADEDESVRKLVGRVLESENYDVVLAESAQEALSKAVSSPPDLVLLDAHLPSGNIKNPTELVDRFSRQVPVILVEDGNDRRRRSRLEGVNAIVEKPFDLLLLLKLIPEVLERVEKDRLSTQASAREQFSAAGGAELPR